MRFSAICQSIVKLLNYYQVSSTSTMLQYFNAVTSKYVAQRNCLYRPQYGFVRAPCLKIIGKDEAQRTHTFQNPKSGEFVVL